MSELDLTRLPQGELAARELVDAVAAHGDELEHHYLEVKSILDFGSKSDVAKIAKFILGAANRMPDTAKRAFDGRAIMVLGVAAGSINGVEPVEVMDIARGVKPYLSADGPRWDVQRLSLDGSSKQVLLIVVDAPEWGQNPFLCHKDGAGLANGAIYIRVEGQTRQAHADEVKQLLERGAERTSSVRLDVIPRCSAFAYSVDDRQTLDAYLTRERLRLRQARIRSIKRSSDPRFGGPNLSALVAGMTIPESRTEDEYEAQIVSWEENTRAAWPSYLDELAAHLFAGAAFEISNGADVVLTDLEVNVHLEGSVDGLEWASPDADARSIGSLPKPPRPWGPRNRFPEPGFRAMDYFAAIPSGLVSTPQVTFRNSGSVSIDIHVGDLRPRKVFETDDDDLVLVVRDYEMAAIRGTWQATVRDRDEVFEGELVVPVEAPRDLTDFVREVLRLEETEREHG